MQTCVQVHVLHLYQYAHMLILKTRIVIDYACTCSLVSMEIQ